MQQHQSLFAEPHQIIIQPYLVAPDSIGIVSDSVPVHPDDKHPSFDDFRKKNSRKPVPDKPSENSNGKHPDSDHQIDEYA
jgi:hypothetical protein